MLLLSVPDFGTPNLLVLAVAVEKPVDGVLKLALGLVFGEPETGEQVGGVEEEDDTEDHHHRRNRHSNPMRRVDDEV